MLLYCCFIILTLYLPTVFQVFKNKQQKEKPITMKQPKE